MSDRIQKKLKGLEKKFNLAKEVLEEVPLPVIIPEVVDDMPLVEYQEDAKTEEEPEPVFELSMLKQDFMLVRGQLKRLINSGQMILTQAQVMDVGDMKSTQLDSLASMQNAIGSNLKLLIDIYEKITKIEKMQAGAIKVSPTGESMGDTYVDKQIVFTGSTTEMLALMNKQEKENDQS